MTTDQIKLTVDLRRRLALAAPFETVGFPGQDGERGLEPVGQRTGPVPRLPDKLLLAVEKAVEVGDHGLDLARKTAAEAGLCTVMHRLQLAVELAERLEALADLEPGAEDEDERDRPEDKDHIAVEGRAEIIDLFVVESHVELEGPAA